jgi:hypothetical protein
MPDEKSQAEPEQQTKNVQNQSANAQAQAATSPQPASNALKPDKTVSVPIFHQCVAGDATPDGDVIRAITPKKTNE